MKIRLEKPSCERKVRVYAFQSPAEMSLTLFAEESNVHQNAVAGACVFTI